MNFWLSRLPDYCVPANYLKLGFDPISIYVDVGASGVTLFHTGCSCLVVGACLVLFNRWAR